MAKVCSMPLTLGRFEDDMTQFFSAWHFDGKTAVRRLVEVQASDKHFLLIEPDRQHGPFGFAELHYVGEQNGAAVYRLDGDDGWRLGLTGPVPTELAPMLPAKRKYGGFIDRIGLGPASIAFALASVAAVAVVVMTPQWLAPLVPAGVEKKMGDALVGDFGGRFCDAPKGRAALAKLTKSLDPNAGELQVEVANIDMLNAVALPGGKVVLFQGLLDQAKSPDEVAGVLAHEIGHVRERHVMQGLLRQMGLAVVLGGFDGNGGATLNNLLSTTYTRESEKEADDHSIKAMTKASISPQGTSEFFERLAQMDGSDRMDKDGQGRALANYTSSHPLSDDRKNLFRKSRVKGKVYQPSLTYDEWIELKTMCAQDRNVKSGWGFDIE
jgi:beta-barrel assembly-enhancing protease